MPLRVEHVRDADFDTMAEYIYNCGGDLIAPIVPMFWPDSSDNASNTERNKWSLQQQREIFRNDPTARFLKVVDTDNNNDIISLARWHFYPEGYQHPQFTVQELDGAGLGADNNWPLGPNKDLAKAIVDTIFGERPTWTGQKPQWVLCTLMTKAPQRRRGAGGMLVSWGIEQARKDKVPAYLEASPAGAPLYQSLGFKKIGEQWLHLQQFGFSEPFPLALMAANTN